MRLHIAADIGGTFTDLVAFDAVAEAVRSFKVLTTYPDRSIGLLAGIERVLRDFGAGWDEVEGFVHGSTIATNTLVEMKGARCGLITTRGFRDLMELRRQKRPSLYDLQVDKPVPLVERRLRLEATERMRADGSILRALAEDEVDAAARCLAAEGVEAIVIAFLHAYANPAHEQRAKAIAERAAPGIPVYASADVCAQFREFERLSTAVVNGYVGPVVDLYLRSLVGELAARGWQGEALVLKCDGGVAGIEEVRRTAVATIGSGPAAGVRGAMRAIAGPDEDRNLITLDMGGTSTDVALVVKGRPFIGDQRDVAGWPIKGAAIGIESIGAGGGSIAWIDPGGLLQVGPASAGSTPGPACYGRGGALPTVTDANVVLGRLRSLVGGELLLDEALARKAIEEHIARPLGQSVEAAAAGILQIATAGMEQAIRLLTVERGHDPRDFLLVAFGGAGPLHAPIVARALGLRRSYVPPAGGTLSALGALLSDVTKDFVFTGLRILDAERVAAIAAAFEELDRAAEAWLADVPRPAGVRRIRSIDMRVRRQNYELNLPLPDDLFEAPPSEVVARLLAAFHALHEQTYGYAFQGVTLECVTYRLRLELPTGRNLPEAASPCSAGTPRPAERRRVLFDLGQGAIETPVFAQDGLTEDWTNGPAVIDLAGATALVLPGQRARQDRSGGIWIEEGAAP
ncbi:MAG: hydantoinase/oxoprolinase family protein [Variibacter sp.]|nr:hydantoinase/oxoprolinase family protein [Variibacter sp.]